MAEAKRSKRQCRRDVRLLPQPVLSGVLRMGSVVIGTGDASIQLALAGMHRFAHMLTRSGCC